MLLRKLKNVSVSLILLILISSCDKENTEDNAKLIWSDEFNGNTLDASKWRHYQLGPRRDAINIEECTYLDGEGNLCIVTKEKEGEIYTGFITTRDLFHQKHGFFECRVELQKSIGHWSAFWLSSPNVIKPDPYINGTEIDIYEFFKLKKEEENVCYQNLFWKDADNLDSWESEIHKTFDSDLAKGYHTFAVDWSLEGYIFYIDGVETYRTTKGISNTEQYIILSLEVQGWAGNIKDANLPDTVRFDYVRVYDKRPK